MTARRVPRRDRVRVRDRAVLRLVSAPFQVRHWRALWGLITVIAPGWEALGRYLWQGGTYPWTIQVHTPTGTVSATLYSRHDLLTVNEIFCRRDYGTDAPQLVVDVGANIGLAALYWLTRRPDSKVYCYEPNPRNLERLHYTLRGYVSRYEVIDGAIALTSGTARFTSDLSGRYGLLSEDEDFGSELLVRTLSLSSELARIRQKEGRLPDLVKIDTEGSEAELVRSLRSPTPALIWEDVRGRVHRQPPR